MPLSEDHKPTLPDELERILTFGGRVDPVFDPSGRPKGPKRVWLKHLDAPGLAMSRSMGDAIGAQAGVISIPEIKEIKIKQDEDCFIISGSDGIWEFLPNEEAAEIIMPYYVQKSAQGAGEALVKEAYYRWRNASEGMVDDIFHVRIR